MAVVVCGGCPVEVCNSHQRCQTSRVSYEGAVLAVWERNGYDDSDFLATVWDAQESRVRDVEYASTRSWTHHNGARVDATPEVRRAALAWYREQWVPAAIERAHESARKPLMGRAARSLTTRGKNVGVVGVVKWIGKDKYRSTRYKTVERVGLKVEGEDTLRYLDLDKVEAAEPAPVDEDEIRAFGATLGEPNWSGVGRGMSPRVECRV
jgi:hypothetical protein